MNEITSEKMLQIVSHAKEKAKQAMDDFDYASDMLEIKTKKQINLYGGTATSEVVDIAAESGTPIVASMEGIVDFVSSEGDYGKHIKIRCNNVTTLYAHCSKIFVKEGQIVAEGQKIASVGNTGNSTGPHLHFEIRVEDRFVDPARIIKF